MALDFRLIEWNTWDASIHFANGQLERIERAAADRRLCVLHYDEKSETASVMGSGGEVYSTCKDGCTCADFKARGLPCKHMYLLAMTLSEKRQDGGGT